MAERPNHLSEALRAIAREDAARAPEAPDARLLAAFRERTRRPRISVRGLAIAASFAAAVATSVWLVARSTRALRPNVEVATAFIALPYSGVPYVDARLVRMEVPRAALTTFGLAPIELADTAKNETVLADVLVGEDGLARAVRFVRAPGAQGEAP